VTRKRPSAALVVFLGLGSPGLWAQSAEDLPQAPPLVGNEFTPASDSGGRLLGSLPPLELNGDGRRTMGRFVPNLGRNLVTTAGARGSRPTRPPA